MAATNESVDPRTEEVKGWRGGVLKVVLVKGSGLAACDIGGSSDPYAIVQWLDSDGNVVGDSVKSPVVKKSLFPEWDFELPTVRTSEEWTAARLHVTVFDKDLLSKDDFMGQCDFDAEKMWAKACYGNQEVFTALKGRLGKKDKHVVGNVTISFLYDVEELRERYQAYAREKRQIETAKEEAERAAKEEHARLADIDKELYDAVLADDEESVKKALADGKSPDAQSKFSTTRAIHVAFARGNVAIAKMLMDAGVDTAARNGDGRSILILAQEYSVENDDDAAIKEALLELALSTEHGSAQAKSQQEWKEKLEREKEEQRRHEYLMATGKTGYEED
jgi:C2 domain